MLRYPSRVLAHTPAMRSAVSPALLTSSRPFTDKIVIGSGAALLTCSTTLGLFHLLVTPVSATIGAATLATAAASGAMCVIDGGSTGGSSFGAVVGVMIGAMGGYIAKSKKEPWRK